VKDEPAAANTQTTKTEEKKEKVEKDKEGLCKCTIL